MTSWPVDSKVLKRLDHPHVVSWQTWQIAGCIITWVFHVWPAIMCWIFLRCDLQVRIFEDFEDEQCGSPGFDDRDFFSPEKIHCKSRWGASIWSWSHVVEGICWSGQMMGLARNGGWEASYLVSLGVGQGVFKCSSWACSMDPWTAAFAPGT